jgi:hypothetical protein
MLTAKISLPAVPRAVPQATVNLKAAPVAAAAPVAVKPAAAAGASEKTEVSAATSEAVSTPAVSTGEGTPIFAIAAATVALISLGVQLWTMLG